MEVKFNCESCGCYHVFDEEDAGCVVQCSRCGQNMMVPHPQAEGSILCSFCGGANRQDTKICIYCRRDLKDGNLVIPQRKKANPFASRRRSRSERRPETELSLDLLVAEQEAERRASAPTARPVRERRGFAMVCVIGTGFLLGFASIGVYQGLTEDKWDFGMHEVGRFLVHAMPDR